MWIVRWKLEFEGLHMSCEKAVNFTENVFKLSQSQLQ